MQNLYEVTYKPYSYSKMTDYKYLNVVATNIAKANEAARRRLRGCWNNDCEIVKIDKTKDDIVVAR